MGVSSSSVNTAVSSVCRLLPPTLPSRVRVAALCHLSPSWMWPIHLGTRHAAAAWRGDVRATGLPEPRLGETGPDEVKLHLAVLLGVLFFSYKALPHLSRVPCGSLVCGAGPSSALPVKPCRLPCSLSCSWAIPVTWFAGSQWAGFLHPPDAPLPHRAAFRFPAPAFLLPPQHLLRMFFPQTSEATFFQAEFPLLFLF